MAQTMSKKALLSNLSIEHTSLLLSKAEQLEVQRDEVILQSGEKAKYFYVLLKGSVVVEVVQPGFSVRIQALNPGEAFGWSALLSGTETLFQVRAREQCTIACIDGEQLRSLCNAEPEFGVPFLFSVLHLVARRVHGTEMRFAEFCGVARRTTKQRPAQPISREMMPPHAGR
jgi:CRP-like cAMP-binding protein